MPRKQEEHHEFGEMKGERWRWAFWDRASSDVISRALSHHEAQQNRERFIIRLPPSLIKTTHFARLSPAPPLHPSHHPQDLMPLVDCWGGGGRREYVGRWNLTNCWSSSRENEWIKERNKCIFVQIYNSSCSASGGGRAVQRCMRCSDAQGTSHTREKTRALYAKVVRALSLYTAAVATWGWLDCYGGIYLQEITYGENHKVRHYPANAPFFLFQLPPYIYIYTSIFFCFKIFFF